MSEQRPARAHVRTNIIRDGVDIAISPSNGPDGGTILLWPGAPSSYYLVAGENLPANMESQQWLTLRDDQARALYEGLAEHYGVSSTDTRRLQADHAGERRRVDRLTDALIRVAVAGTSTQP